MTAIDFRPVVALAMHAGLEPVLLGHDTWERLDAVADVVDRVPLRDLHDARADDVLAQVDVLVTCWGCPFIDDAVLDRAPRLRMIAHAAGTVRNHLTPAVWDRGLLVTSAAVAGAIPVAEFTVAAVLFAGKDVFRVRDEFRATRGRTDVRARNVVDPRIGNLGRRIAIVGASHVGRLVLERLRPFGFEMRLYDPFVEAAEAAALGAEKAELHDLLRWADVVSIHAPALSSTHNMFGAAEFAAMRDGAWLLNTARGWLVDHHALEKELVTGRISALIDTSLPEPLPADSPLYDLPNVVLTPHIAGVQGNELVRMADLAVDEIERYAQGLPPLYPVTADDLTRVA